MGVRDVMTYIWMPPQAYQRTTYVCNSFLKRFHQNPIHPPAPSPHPPTPTHHLQKKCHIHVKYFTIFNSRFTLGHLVALGPLTSPNLNISTIWVRDPWISIQINFWGSLLPTKEVPHMCKIVNYF